ncbi:MAG TPA: peptidylprolyl isomerase [Victivallales bacterium]|nr:peptidylprolyl isomerase [Victivallales bacterium]
MKKILLAAMFLIFSLQLFSADADAKPMVEMQTSMGNITIQLYPKKAPKTVANFLGYVKSGFYNDTIFHRVIEDFMIQGGGYTAKYVKKPTKAPIVNEADNGLKNTIGTIAMARTSNPNSATAQFFINTADNSFLNYKAPTREGWGYAVFGKVVSGMNVVEKIDQVKTGEVGPFYQNAPKTPVIIEKMSVMK